MSVEFKSSSPWRAVGLFVIDTATAVIGPAVIETSIRRLFLPHSIPAIVLKEWCLSITLAAVMGWLMYRTWQSSTAQWIWVLAVLWFSFGALAFFGGPHESSVFFTGSTLWSNFSGIDCAGHPASCRDFFAFSVPLIRALSYSAAAWSASRFYGTKGSRLLPSEHPEAKHI